MTTQIPTQRPAMTDAEVLAELEMLEQRRKKRRAAVEAEVNSDLHRKKELEKERDRRFRQQLRKLSDADLSLLKTTHIPGWQWEMRDKEIKRREHRKRNSDFRAGWERFEQMTTEQLMAYGARLNAATEEEMDVAIAEMERREILLRNARLTLIQLKRERQEMRTVVAPPQRLIGRRR